MAERTSFEGSVAHGIAAFIDLIITVLIRVFIDEVIGWRGSGTSYAFGYYLFKDIIFGGRSPGKRFAGCYVVQYNTGVQCSWLKHFLRIFISFLILPVEMFRKMIQLFQTFVLFALRAEEVGWLVFFRLFSIEWGSHILGLSFVAANE